MISQTAEYALRAIVYLADQRGSPRTTAQIAEATQVPPGYLAKVMQSLSRTKLVHSQRGLNGGFTLTRDPAGLPMLEIIGAVDTLTLYVGPDVSSAAAEAIVQLHPGHVIFNPGSENPVLEARLREAGITHEQACTLVLLRTAQF